MKIERQQSLVFFNFQFSIFNSDARGVGCYDVSLTDPDITCRAGCGACCIALSISSPIPGMPSGKPAGVRCAQLTNDNRCLLFGLPERPAVCVRFRASLEMCGTDAAQALQWIAGLELLTAPG